MGHRMTSSRPIPNQQASVQCLGKQSFASAVLAQKVAGRKTRRSSRQGMNAYRCPHCRAWHIGHHDQIRRGES